METLNPPISSSEAVLMSMDNMLTPEAKEAEMARLTKQIVEDPNLSEYGLLNEDSLALQRRSYEVEGDTLTRIQGAIQSKQAQKKELPSETKWRYNEIKNRIHFLSEEDIRVVSENEPDAEPFKRLLGDSIDSSDTNDKPPFMDYKKNTDEAWQYVPMEAIEDYFTERPFLDTFRLNTKEGAVRLMPESGRTIQVPTDIFVNLQGFDSWMGAGKKGTATKDITSPYYKGEQKGRRTTSIEAIKHYASLPTEIPAVRAVNIYIQPDGRLLADNGSGDSHRIAAAILRGDTTINAESITFRRLENNELTQP